MLYGVKIEIEKGSYCSVVGKLQSDPVNGIGNPMLAGQVEDMKTAVSEKFVKFHGSDTWYPVWRVVEFTFGGIWIINPKFSLKRVEADNARLYKKYFKKKK